MPSIVCSRICLLTRPRYHKRPLLSAGDDETIEELQKHITKYRTSRELILEQIKKIKELDPKNVAPADGGFYIYIDLGDNNIAPGFGSVKMCQFLLEEKYVAFTPGEVCLPRALN